MSGTIYRKLTEAEIAALVANGCSACRWADMEVAPEFTPDEIWNCRFVGTVRLGKNVRIDGVREAIEHYEIGDEVMILHIESLSSTYKSTFGNGTRVAVLNESGGREVPIYNGLTAQIAYIVAMYRHRPEAIRAIETLIANEIQKTIPSLGCIGRGTTITHCGTLTDICTGENAVLHGVAELTNGTVNSTAEAPTTVGRGVIARDFIIADSAEVTDFAHIEKCFIGQGCKIGKGFTADNSLFFANCECLQGEACAIFAGPYTVTHHKSTLLIGGMFSFYNAGSGSNQSNHMYRLGQMHQGVLERGSKTTSSSYILFPARIGAFSIVKGRHYHHPNTSALPFSYLIEDGNDSVILPGANLKSIGTARDTQKWRARDRRKGMKSDLITFDLLNPYIIAKIKAGINTLNEIIEGNREEYNGVKITQRGAKKGVSLYELAIDLYIGEQLAERLKPNPVTLPKAGKAFAAWADLGGLIVPTEEVEQVLDALESGKLDSIESLQSKINFFSQEYPAWEWTYVVSLIAERLKKPVEEISSDDLVMLLEKWVISLREFERLQIEDAQKEFSETMRISYGIDGDEETRLSDFQQIHGSVGEHAFVRSLQAKGWEVIEREVMGNDSEELRDRLDRMISGKRNLLF